MIRKEFVASILLLWSAPTMLSAQSFRLAGRVTDAENGEALPAATIRVMGSARGTIANADGRYALRLMPGPIDLIYSYVGYRTDTIRVSLVTDQILDVALKPIAIEFQEIVVTSEDPAVRIMRKVIENKHIWRDSLHSYRFKAFTRQVLRRDSAIASITESYTEGFWRRGDTLREVVLQKRQTENIPLKSNFAFVGQIQNFYDDDLDFFGYRFVGPTSPEAFDYYRFTLESTRDDHGVPLYDIRIEPRSRVTPLFVGHLTVIGDMYALVGIDVVPNEAYVIPFLSEFSIRYSQGFNLYSGMYWMPTDIRVTGTAEVGIVGISMPRIGFDQTSVIYDYSINAETPDSMFTKPQLISSPEATTFDSTFWANNEVLPLTGEEQTAYQSIDSSETLSKQFAPSGALTMLGSSGLSFLNYVDVRFNRVEGVFLGGKIAVDTLISGLRISAKAGYGFADDTWKYAFGVKMRLLKSYSISAGLDIYDDIAHVPDELQLDALGVSLTALIAKNDPRDYYMVRGFSPSIEIFPLRRWRLTVSYRHEEHRSAVQNTDYSFFFRTRSYREQPEITQGKLRSLVVETRWGEEPIPFGLSSRDFLDLEFEAAPGRAFASDFDFRWLHAMGEVHFADFLRRNLFPPTLVIRASAGSVWGNIPAQRMFSLPSTVSGFGPIGVLRGAGAREFGGSQYIFVAVEQNFRSVPFLLIDLPFLYRNSIEFMLHAAAARSWDQSAISASGDVTDGWYSEVGFGIGKILGFIRCDLSYRMYRPSRFVFTVALSRLL